MNASTMPGFYTTRVQSFFLWYYKTNKIFTTRKLYNRAIKMLINKT